MENTVDLKAFKKQKELVEKFATAAIAEKVDAIHKLVLEIQELQDDSGIKVTIPYGTMDLLSDIDDKWKSSSDRC